VAQALPVPFADVQTDAKVVGLREQLVPVVEPDLTGFDEVVAAQLAEARRGMESVLAEPDADADRLAVAYGTLGQLYHAYELLDVAEACYVNANQMAPRDFRWLHLMADVNRLAGRLEDSAALYEAAWSLEPYDFAALVRFGEVSLELGLLEDAEAAYRRALTLNPGSPSVMAGLGQLALSRQEYDDAVMYFDAALRAAPDANRLHYSLAMAYRGLGDAEAAKRHLEMRGTVGVRPPDPVVEQLQLLKEGERVHLVRGRLAFASGRYQEAADEFGAAVAADPRSARALVNLGTALAQLGDIDAAIGRFEEALEIEPEQMTAHFNLGSTLLTRNHPAEALPHLQKVVAAAPYDAEAQLILARAMVASGDDWESLEHFRHAAELDPANEAAVLGGAAALVRLEQYSRAKSVLEAGRRRMPASGDIIFALARLLVACPDPEFRDGLRALDMAREIFAAKPTPRHAQLMAQAFAELDRCDEAAAWQQRVVDAAIADGADEALTAVRADLERYRAGSPCGPPVE
jgi:tetratricopeptide (TPR) repeat protein